MIFFTKLEHREMVIDYLVSNGLSLYSPENKVCFTICLCIIVVDFWAQGNCPVDRRSTERSLVSAVSCQPGKHAEF